MRSLLLFFSIGLVVIPLKVNGIKCSTEHYNDSTLLLKIKGLTFSKDAAKGQLMWLDSIVSANNNRKSELLIYSLAVSTLIKKHTSEKWLPDLNKTLRTIDAYWENEEATTMKNNVAIFFGKKHEYSVALGVFKSVAEDHLESKRITRWAESRFNEAIVYKNLSNFEESIEIAFTSAKVFMDSSKNLNLAKAYNTIGSCYKGLKRYSKALEYHQKSLLLKQNNSSSLKSIASSYNNVANVYRITNWHDSAITYYSLYQEIGEKLNDSVIISRAIDNISETYYLIEQYDLSLLYVNRAIFIRKKINDRHGLAVSLTRKARLELIDSNYKSAIELLSNARSLAEDLSLKIERLEIVNLLGKVYWHLKKYDAFMESNIEYLSLKDSIFNESTFTAIEQAEAIYQVDLINQELLFEKERRFKEERFARRMVNIIFIISILVLALVIIGIRLYQSFKFEKFLLRELRHRTTNDFQALQSAISINKVQVKNGVAPEEVLNEMFNRVNNVGRLHNLLEINKKGLVNMKLYLDSVINHVCSAYGINQDKCVNVEIDELLLNTKSALLVGSIITEASINSFKHAFFNCPNPSLDIQFVQEGRNNYWLRIKDNGNGKLSQNDYSMGIDLLRYSASCLGGELLASDQNGVSFDLRFSQ